MRILKESQWITFLSIIFLDTFVKGTAISNIEETSRVIEMGPDNFLKAIREQCKSQKSISYICNNLRLILPVAESVLQDSSSTKSNTRIQHNGFDKDSETTEIIHEEEQSYYYPLEDEGVNQSYNRVPPPVTVQTKINFKQSGVKSKHKKRYAEDDAFSGSTELAQDITPRNTTEVHAGVTTAEDQEAAEEDIKQFNTAAETASSPVNETINTEEENEDEYGSGAEDNGDSEFSQEDEISADNSKEKDQNLGEAADISSEIPEENTLKEDENSEKEPKFFLRDIASRLFKPNALTLKIPPAAVFAATIAQWVDRYLIHTSTVEQGRAKVHKIKSPLMIGLLIKAVVVISVLLGFVIKIIIAKAVLFSTAAIAFIVMAAVRHYGSNKEPKSGTVILHTNHKGQTPLDFLFRRPGKKRPHRADQRIIEEQETSNRSSQPESTTLDPVFQVWEYTNFITTTPPPEKYYYNIEYKPETEVHTTSSGWKALDYRH